MPREEATPNQSSPYEEGLVCRIVMTSSDTGNAGSGAGNSGADSAGSQAEPGSVPVIKPIALEPHRRGLFEIPKISRRREK